MREAERPPAEGLRGPSWSLTALLTILSAPSLSLSLHLSLFLSRPDPLAFYGTRDATSPFRFVRRQEGERGGTGRSGQGGEIGRRPTLFAGQKSRVIGDAELNLDFDPTQKRSRTNLGIGGEREGEWGNKEGLSMDGRFTALSPRTQ